MCVVFEKFFTVCFSAGILFLVCGCSSIIDSRTQKKELADAYLNGQMKTAARLVTEKSMDCKDSGDAVMWYLEAALIKFDAGMYQQSLKDFECAEKMIADFDERASVSVRDGSAEAGSAVTNLNSIPYRGFCCDRMLLNTYKALAYFALKKPSSGNVELRRLRETQKLVERRFEDEIEKQRKEIEKSNRENAVQTKKLASNGKKTKEKSNVQSGNITFNSLLTNESIKEAYEESGRKSEKAYGNLMNPFPTYMSAIGYLTEKNYNEACVDFRNLYRMNKANPLIARDYVSCARRLGMKIPDELKNIPEWKYPLHKDIVFVVFANGRGPALKEVKIQLILPYVGYTGMAFPCYEYFKRTIKQLTLTANSREFCTSQLVDMDNVVSEEYHKRLPTMITRLVVSYLVKETASLLMVEAMKSQGTAAHLIAYGTTGLYKYLFNTADTRCWESLPGEVQLVHFPIPKNREVILNLPVAKNPDVVKNGQADKTAKSPKPAKAPKPAKTEKTEKTQKPQKPGQKIIRIGKDSNFVIVYVRGINNKLISIKKLELNLNK